MELILFNLSINDLYLLID